MLFIHWKQVRWPLLPFAVLAFGLPLLSIQGLGGDLISDPLIPAFSDWAIVSLPAYPALAFLTGVLLALTAWNWDHQLNHVYALSLPLARWEYALLKMGAGAALALVPTLSLWIGAHIAAASVVLPEGLHAYPNQLAFRFFIAVLFSYSLLFALAAGTVKTVSWSFAIGFAAIMLLGNLSFLDIAIQYLWRPGGPFEVLTGSWALIDV